MEVAKEDQYGWKQGGEIFRECGQLNKRDPYGCLRFEPGEGHQEPGQLQCLIAPDH